MKRIEVEKRMGTTRGIGIVEAETCGLIHKAIGVHDTAGNIITMLSTPVLISAK